MSVVRWTDEKLAALKAPELQNLLTNVGAFLAAGKISQADCEDLSKRIKEQLVLQRKVRLQGARTPRAATLEKRVAVALAGVADELAKRYDLSPETARSLSVGAKNFKAHNLTAKNGEAKTGGAMQEGKLAIDRYISYRVKDDIVSLAFILFKGAPEEEGRYFLVGTDSVLAEGHRFGDALAGKADYGWSAAFTARMNAVTFTELAPAAAAYEALVAKLAPRLSGEIVQESAVLA